MPNQEGASNEQGRRRDVTTHLRDGRAPYLSRTVQRLNVWA